MELYFVRCGPTSRSEKGRDGADERPLSDEGKELIVWASASLTALGASPDCILCSPHVHARQTAAMLADCLGIPKKLVADQRLAPGFGREEMASILRDYRESNALVLVGHQPDLGKMIRRVIGRGQLALRRGAIARVEVPDHKHLAGRLTALVPPPARPPAGPPAGERTRPDVVVVEAKLEPLPA